MSKLQNPITTHPHNTRVHLEIRVFSADHELLWQKCGYEDANGKAVTRAIAAERSYWRLSNELLDRAYMKVYVDRVFQYREDLAPRAAAAACGGAS